MSALLLDVTRLLYRHMRAMLPTGIDRVGIEYVRHFRERAQAVVSRGGVAAVLPAAASRAAFAALLDGARQPVRSGGLLARALLWDRHFARGHASVLLNAGHYGLENPAYAGALRARGARVAVFVHDLIPISHPQYCRAGEDARHARRMRNALGFARGVIVNSRDTLEQLRRFAGEAGARLPPSIVAPLAACLAPGAGGAAPIGEPYFVVLGTVEPRKNHRLLLDIWPHIAERLGAAAPRLVVIGQRGWHCDDLLAAMQRTPGVVRVPRCSDDALAGWLRHARALLMPSHVEGYGLPVAEALALGAPVIGSDLPVFREIAGEVPDYAKPDGAEDWIDLITDYAGPGSARRAAQLQRMALFRPPTWADHFAAVDAFLASI